MKPTSPSRDPDLQLALDVIELARERTVKEGRNSLNVLTALTAISAHSLYCFIIDKQGDPPAEARNIVTAVVEVTLGKADGVL